MLERCLDCSETPEPVHPTKVPRTKEEIASFRCDRCELISCCICGDQPRNTLATLGRITTKGDSICLQCKDCWHPQCTSKSCSTCRTCRSVSCNRKGSCQQPVIPLNAKELPTNLEGKPNFRCSACKFPACSVCKKTMPAGSRNRFARSERAEWTCGDCLTLEESKKVRAKYVA